VYDEFFYHGTNLSAAAALADAIACGDVVEDDEESEQNFWDYYEAGEEEYSLEIDGLSLGLVYLGGAPLVYVFRSPHIAQASVCSPCVPSAGDLDSQHAGGIDCYTLPPDWFRSDN